MAGADRRIAVHAYFAVEGVRSGGIGCGVFGRATMRVIAWADSPVFAQPSAVLAAIKEGAL